MASPPKYGAFAPKTDSDTKRKDDWDIFGFFKSDQKLDRIEVEADMFDDTNDPILNPANVIQVEDDIFDDDDHPDPLEPRQYVEVEDDLFDDEQSAWFPTNMGKPPQRKDEHKFHETQPIDEPMTPKQPTIGDQENPLFGPEAGAYSILQRFAEIGGEEVPPPPVDQSLLQAPPQALPSQEGKWKTPLPDDDRVLTSYEQRARELARDDRQELQMRPDPVREAEDDPNRAGVGIAIAPHESGAMVVDMERGGAAELSGKMAVGDLILSANGRDLGRKSVAEIVKELTGPEGTYCVLLTRKGVPPFPTQTVVLSRTSHFLNRVRAAEDAQPQSAEGQEQDQRQEEEESQRDGRPPVPHTSDFSESFLRDWAHPGVFNEDAKKEAMERRVPGYPQVAAQEGRPKTVEESLRESLPEAQASMEESRVGGRSFADSRSGSTSVEVENRMLKYELEELAPGSSKMERPKSIFDQLGDMVSELTAGGTPKGKKKTTEVPVRDYGNNPPPAAEYLSVTVVEARNVPSEDLVGMNAHFCRVRSGPQVYCTKNQRWTLNPAFDKAFLLPLSNSKDLSIELVEVPLLGGAENKVGFVEFNLMRLLEDVRRQPVSGLQTMRTRDESGAAQILKGTAAHIPCQLLLSFEIVPGTPGAAPPQ